MVKATTARRKLPGSGDDCSCGEHRKMCRFGHQHSWSMGFIPEALAEWFGVDIEVARRAVAFCNGCDGAHVPQPGEEW